MNSATVLLLAALSLNAQKGKTATPKAAETPAAKTKAPEQKPAEAPAAEVKPAEAKPAEHAAEPEVDDPELPHVGQEAPRFRLLPFNPSPNQLGQVSLDKLVGEDREDMESKVVVVSFMASYCAPCKKEMPYLQQLHEKYAAKGLRVLMVSVDTEDKGFQVINQLIADSKVTFPVLKDRFNIAARAWLGNRTPLPSLFILDANGIVQVVKRGYDEKASAQLLAEIEKRLESAK